MSMTYSIFDATSGNLIEWFDTRGPALEFLASIAQTEPEAADEVFLIASDDETGEWVGDAIFASSVSTPA